MVCFDPFKSTFKGVWANDCFKGAWAVKRSKSNFEEFKIIKISLEEACALMRVDRV